MTTTDQINSLETEIQEAKIKIRLLKQIQHFGLLYNNSLIVIDSLPDTMKHTTAVYRKKSKNYRETIFNLKKQFSKL